MLSTDKLLKTMPSAATENWGFSPLLSYISSCKPRTPRQEPIKSPEGYQSPVFRFNPVENLGFVVENLRFVVENCARTWGKDLENLWKTFDSVLRGMKIIS
jgi:hypothetical protein